MRRSTHTLLPGSAAPQAVDQQQQQRNQQQRNQQQQQQGQQGQRRVSSVRAHLAVVQGLNLRHLLQVGLNQLGDLNQDLSMITGRGKHKKRERVGGWMAGQKNEGGSAGLDQLSAICMIICVLLFKATTGRRQDGRVHRREQYPFTH